MAADPRSELVTLIYKESPGWYSNTPTGDRAAAEHITTTLLANPDVVLRALGIYEMHPGLVNEPQEGQRYWWSPAKEQG